VRLWRKYFFGRWDFNPGAMYRIVAFSGLPDASDGQLRFPDRPTVESRYEPSEDDGLRHFEMRIE
jgi:hypothetical protein